MVGNMVGLEEWCVRCECPVIVDICSVKPFQLIKYNESEFLLSDYELLRFHHINFWKR